MWNVFVGLGKKMGKLAVGKAGFLPWEISCLGSVSSVSPAPQRQACVTQGAVGYSLVTVKEKKKKKRRIF